MTSMNCRCLTSTFFVTNSSVPLKSVSVDVRIEGFIANVESTQIYKNVSKDPIEVRYEFPMDDQSVVYHFEAQIEDRVIIAECQEKQQAKVTYDEAVSEGYGAVLMQESDYVSDIFSCLVGNLPPNAEAVVKFGYVTELSLQPDGILTFLLPTILNPRFNPSVLFRGTANPSDHTSFKIGEDQPYKFEIRATIINPAIITSVNAKNDELNVKMNDDKTKAEVTLAKPFVANHDFTLDVSFEEIAKPHIIIEKGDESKDGILKRDVLMLNFFPELKADDYTSKHEFIFVVDRSGSMAGQRMRMAKEALLLFLKSLPPGCYFNIIGFGSSFEVLFPEGSREYAEDSLEAATDLQQTMGANLGGTDILQPLAHIYKRPTLSTHIRNILLLTDGDVTNSEAVINMVRHNANNTTVFSFGIGEGASTSLVKGIARAGRGRAEFTKEGDRLQPLVVKTLKAAMQSAVTDLHLEWLLGGGGSPDIVQLPEDLSPLFAGEKLIIYAMALSDKVVLDGKVRLKGKIGERPLEFGLDVDSAKNIEDGSFPIHRLAAKAQIKQLQDAGKDENKAAIVLLSTAANVISCHTSMVGVDKHRKEKVVGTRVRKNIPVLRGSHSQLVGTSLGPPMRMSSSAMPGSHMPIEPQRRVTVHPPPACSKSFAFSHSSGSLRSFSGSCFEAERSAPMIENSSKEALRSAASFDAATGFQSMPVAFQSGRVAPVPPTEPTHLSLVSLQKFSGEWELDKDLAEVIKISIKILARAAPVKAQNVWATVLALCYLDVKFGDKRDEWEMVDRKARQWLHLQDHEGHTVDDLMSKARAVLIIGKPSSTGNAPIEKNHE